MHFMEYLSRRVKAMREQRGLSQYALARDAGVPQVTIWRIESGRQKGVDARLMRRIAIALNVSMDDLGGRFEASIDDRQPAVAS